MATTKIEETVGSLIVPKEEYVKLMYRTTLRQLKEHGVETAWVYNFGYWEDHQAETWEINHSRKHIKDWQVELLLTLHKN